MADDLLNKLNAGFSRLGKHVRAGAKELKKTAGIGVGTMNLALDRFDFRPGDTITGTVKLALEEPMEAKNLTVRLTGSRERVGYERDASGKQTQTKHTETLCDMERELAGARSYHRDSYSFELTIPSDIDKPIEVDSGGILGDVARVVQSVAQGRSLPASWRIVAKLDIPWKRNLEKKVDITVRE